MSGPDTQSWGDVPMGFHAESKERSAQVIQVESSKLLLPVIFIALIACLLSGAAIGLSVGARDTANNALKIAERETRLQRLETDELKVALKAQGIKIHED